MSSTYAQVGRSVAREWQKLTCRLCSDLHFSGPRRLSGGQSVGGEFDACESAVTRGFFSKFQFDFRSFYEREQQQRQFFDARTDVDSFIYSLVSQLVPVCISFGLSDHNHPQWKRSDWQFYILLFVLKTSA